MAYKYNIIFNSAEQSRKGSTVDTILAAAFADKLEVEMKRYGYRGYNPDKHARLGSSVVKEHTRIVKETDFTIIIVTPEFFNDYWSDYKNEAAFNFLTRKGERHRLIPIALHTEELGELDVNTPLFFPDENSWQDDDKWRRLKLKFEGREHHDVPQPVQDNGDNILRTNRQNIVTRPVSAASSLASFDESIDNNVESQGLPVANNESLTGDVDLADGHIIPEPPTASMERLSLTGGILYTRDPSAGISMDGPRSEDNQHNRSIDTDGRSEGLMDTHQNDETTTAATIPTSNSNVHRELPDGEEISRILDDAPTLSQSSLPEYDSSETPQPIAYGPGDASTTSNVAPELLEVRGTATNDTDHLNDDDLDVDDGLHSNVLQSPTLPSHSPRREAEINTMQTNKSTPATDTTQTPEHISNTQCVSDTYVKSPAGERSEDNIKSAGEERSGDNFKSTMSDHYYDTSENKPEEADGFNARNLAHAGVNMVMNVFRWLGRSDRAFY